MKPHLTSGLVLLACLIALSLTAVGCAPVSPATALPTATAVPATPIPTAPPASATPPPTATAASSPTPTPSRALRALGVGETLSLLAEIPVLSVTFGLRSAFSPSGPVVYHTGVGPQIEGYDYRIHETVFRLGGFPRGAPLGLEVSPTGGLLIAEDGPTLGVWALPQGEQLAGLEMPAMFSPVFSGFVGADSVYGADSNGNVALWDTASWEQRWRLFVPGGIDAAFVLPSGDAVVVLPRSGEGLLIAGAATGELRDIPMEVSPWRLVGISPDGRRAIVHVSPGKANEGILIMSLEDPQDSVAIPLLNIRELAVSEDWGTLAVTDVGETLYLFDPQDGSQFYSQPMEAFRIMGLSLSADGTLLAVHVRSAGSTAGAIQVWGRELP